MYFFKSKTIELSVLDTVVEFMTLCCTVNLTSDKSSVATSQFGVFL